MIITFRFYWTHSHTVIKETREILYTLYTSTTTLNSRYIDNNNHKNTWITKYFFIFSCVCFFLFLQTHKHKYAYLYTHTNTQTFTSSYKETLVYNNEITLVLATFFLHFFYARKAMEFLRTVKRKKIVIFTK